MEEKYITLKELGVNLDKMNLELGLEPPVCCNEECLLCMKFDDISSFILDTCSNKKNFLLMAIMMDESYLCGLQYNGKMYKVGHENLSYKGLIPEVIHSYPAISSIIVIQHVSTGKDDVCEFKVITK